MPSSTVTSRLTRARNILKIQRVKCESTNRYLRRIEGACLEFGQLEHIFPFDSDTKPHRGACLEFGELEHIFPIDSDTSNIKRGGLPSALHSFSLLLFVEQYRPVQ